MGTKINHKRYINLIPVFRIKRSAFKALEEVGYYDFVKEWDEHLKLSLSGIRDQVSEEHCSDLLDIRNRACELYIHCAYFFYRDTEDYDEQHFFNEIGKLLEEHTKITTEYKIDDDIQDNEQFTERILALNDASFILRKPYMKDKYPSMVNYVSGSLEYLKNKKIYQIADNEPVKSNISTKVRHPAAEIHYNGTRMTADQVALILVYLGRAGTITEKTSPNESLKYGMEPGKRLHNLVKKWKKVENRQVYGATRLVISNQIERLNQLKPFIDGASVAAIHTFNADLAALQKNNI